MSADPIAAAVRALRQGEVIACPTETLYGLSVDPWNPRALERLLHLKGRPESKGMILLIASPAGLDEWTETLPPLAKELIALFWPGPLTLVLPARPALPESLTGGSGWVAVRQSSAPVVAALLERWQGSMVSTSANRHGQPPLSSGAAVRQQWGEQVACVVEGPPLEPEALPSTVLRVDGSVARLLRPGTIPAATLIHRLPGLDLRDLSGTRLR